MFQIPIEVDFNNIDPEKFKDMQNVDWQALADLSTNPATQETAGRLAWLAGGMLIVVGIVAIIAIILMILNLFNIWHWGTTDKVVYEAAGQTKKKWFMIFFIVPLIAALIGIIPIIGWLASLVLYIYWLVMVLVYFFGVRKRVGNSPTSSSTPISIPTSNQGNKSA